MISVKGLSKSLGGQKVLEDISFEVNDGEIVAILGPSGTGKTVLLKQLIGLMMPDQGHIFVNGEDITLMDEPQLLKVRQSMGYLFQEGALYDFMDVYDNVAFPLREHTTMDAAAIKKRVDEVLGMVDLDGVEAKLPSELSGGMKKRVGLARAIVLGAKILLCDEPTSGLDPIRSRDISDSIKQVSRKMGATTVITSHDIDNSFRIADRLILLNESHIVAQGNKKQLSVCEAPFVREFFQGHVA